MPFLGQEGHVLRARRACSEMLSRPFCNREGHEEGRGEVFLSRWGVLSLTEHTKFTEVLSARVNSWVSFSLTERAKFTEVLSARINSWGSFSLTEYTDLTEPFCARFEPTEGLRHTEVTEAFQLTLAVTFCDIGWLNVSVECCVFCSSVFFCEK